MDYLVKSKLLGYLKINSEDGLFQTYTIDLFGKSHTFNLYIFEETINEANSHIVKSLIDNIQAMYERGKIELIKEVDSEIVRYFIDFHKEELGPELLDLFNLNSLEDLSDEIFIRNLNLRMLAISENEEGKLEATMDFSLDENYSDELLVLRYNEDFEIFDISHES